MTTITMNPSATVAPRSSAGQASFRNALASEWAKLASLRSTHVTLGLGFLISVATTALTAVAVSATRSEWPADMSPVTVSMVGNIFALIIYSVFAVMAVSREYANGTIRVTLIATPSRSRVLLAKFVVVGLTLLVAGLATTLAMFYTGQAVLSANGMPVGSLGSSDARWMVLGLGAAMPFFPLMGLAIGVLLRSTAAGITTVLGLLWLPQIFGAFAPSWMQEHVLSMLPSNAIDSITVSRIEDSPAFSDPLLGGIVAALWLSAIVAASFVAITRRDA